MNKYAFMLLCHGLYAVLCQSALLFTFVSFFAPSLPPDVLLHRYAPFLEYPLMSLLLVLGGALLIQKSLENSP